jgi:hypothetical protein
VRIALMLAILMTAISPSNVLGAARSSLIPPIVLQGCAEKVDAGHSNFWAGRSIFGNGHSAAGNAKNDQIVGFDLSFVNTTNKAANIVLVRIGNTDFAKTGIFSPNAVIAWRIAAKSGGDCLVKAVRFDDGTEWDAPEMR